MVLDDVVLCARGLRVAQRGAGGAFDGAGLRVGDISPVIPPAAPPLEARRQDTVVWRRHWLEDRRLVIEFVGVAVVEVDEGTGIVTFDRALPRQMEQHLLFDHVLPLALARRGAIVVHGGVISREGKAVVLLGASGAGKSTLTAFAWQQGWTVGGDDGAVLVATEPPTVEPTYSTVRLKPASLELLGLEPEPASEVVGKMRIAGRGDLAFRQEPVEVRVVARLHPAEDGVTARFDQMSGIDAHATLFKSTFHGEWSAGDLLPAVVAGLATIAERTTVGRLTVPRGRRGLAAAEELLRAHLESLPHRASA